MRFELKDFQVEAVDRLHHLATRASAAVEEDGPQTLVLSAPTGSGKTVMAAAWMENLLAGTELYEADPSATFLWLTDQPELNEQTRRKLAGGATTFTDSELITIDGGFSSDLFEPGRVYFLNTQKLGRNSNLVKAGDRGRTLWTTIASTAETRPGSFWLIVDEAHRGMVESPQDRRTAETIVQKFLKGSDGEIPAMPLILGISATPDRFTAVLAGTDRTTRPPVNVDIEAVRSSGLLKDAITLYHPDESQPSDLTLLRAASEQIQRYDQEWSAYSKAESAPAVSPVLVVQVEDAGAKSVTKTDVGACLTVIERVLGPLGDVGVAHSFQEGHSVSIGAGRSLRYVAPSDIQDDAELKVVFFKRSLTTGWDCPRAEVMMSFRRAIDETLIAQLVGRMVRTPLARSVSGSDFLNSVCLYLPHYDGEALNSVIERLTDPDPEVGFPTRVRRGERLVTLTQNPAVAEAFEAAAELITYRVEKVSKQSNIRRLLRLGRLLAWDRLDIDASDSFTKELVAVLDAQCAAVSGTGEFERRLRDAATIDLRAVTVLYGRTEETAVASTQIGAVSENVEHAFAEAGRKLGGGLNFAYLRSRAAQAGGMSVGAVKLELYALLLDPAVLTAVESRAGELLTDALERFKVPVRGLNDDRRQKYRHIRRQAAKPEPEPWELFPSIEGEKEGNTTLDRHLYIKGDGSFSCTLNEWEREVLSAALADDQAVGWLRNEPRKAWSFAVPYESGREFKPMYPDFLIFRRQGSGIVCDVLEPHSLSYEDSAAKARGLAAFARDHGDEFGRIRLIAKVGGVLRSLALDDIATRERVLSVATGQHLKQLFEDGN